MKEKILCICAHSDDQILGPGGTLAKYAKEGNLVNTIIFSHGVLSHPHFKEEVIKAERIKEAEKADKVINGGGVKFYDLQEGKFKCEEAEELIEKDILNFKPTKIFTHAHDKGEHPDHIAVFDTVIKVYDKLHKENKIKCDIYSFGIWRLFKTKNRNNAKLVIDIGETFATKLEALDEFSSQKVAMIMLKWSIYFKAFLLGFKNNMTFAEEFNKER